MRYYACVRNHSSEPTTNGNSFTNCLDNRDRGRRVSYFCSKIPKFTVGRIYKSVDGNTVTDDECKLILLKDVDGFFVEVKFELDEISRRIIKSMECAGLYVRIEPISVISISDTPNIMPVCLMYISSSKHHFSHHVYYTLDSEKNTIDSLRKLWKQMRVCSDMALSIARGLNMRIAPYIENLRV